MFTLARNCFEAMVQDAKARLPNEACGIFSGKETATTFFSMKNTEGSPASYLMDPTEQFQAMKQIRQKGERMLGIYHSHVKSPAYPSAKDVALAFYPDVSYVVVSLSDEARPVTKAYRIQDGSVQEDALTVV